MRATQTALIDDFDGTAAIPRTGTWELDSITVYTGTYSLGTGTTGHSESKTVEFDVSGALGVGFVYKVSSEAGHDVLTASLVGGSGTTVEILNASGEVDWTRFAASDADMQAMRREDTLTLRLVFSRDASIDGGSNAAWLGQAEKHELAPPRAFINNFSTTLSADATADATTLTLAGSGDQLADAAPDNEYLLTIEQTPAPGTIRREVVAVVGADTADPNIITVKRAQEGTTALTLAAGDAIELRATANTMNRAVTLPLPAEIGLGRVDNTADLDKPVSTAAQAALDDHDAIQQADLAAIRDDIATKTDQALTAALAAPVVLDAGTLDASNSAATADTATPIGTQLYTDELDVIVTALASGPRYLDSLDSGSTGLTSCFNHAGTQIAFTDANGLRVYEYPTMTLLTTITLSNAYDAAYSPDDAMLAIAVMGDFDSSIVVYNTADWTRVAGIATETTDPDGWCDQGRALNWSPDGTLLAFGHSNVDMYFTVYNTADWTIVTLSARPVGSVYGVTWAPDGSQVACTHMGAPYLTVYSTADWSILTTTPDMGERGWNIAWSPDGSKVAWVGYYGTARILNAADWTVFATHAEITANAPDNPNQIAWSPDSATLAMGLYSQGVGLLDVATFGVELLESTINDTVQDVNYDDSGDLVTFAVWNNTAANDLQYHDLYAYQVANVPSEAELNLGTSSTNATSLLAAAPVSFAQVGERQTLAINAALPVGTLHASVERGGSCAVRLVARGYLTGA